MEVKGYKCIASEMSIVKGRIDAIFERNNNNQKEHMVVDWKNTKLCDYDKRSETQIQNYDQVIKKKYTYNVKKLLIVLIHHENKNYIEVNVDQTRPNKP